MSDGRAGFLSFGPYISLDPGEYVVGFYLRRVGIQKLASFEVDAVAAGGKALAAERYCQADLFDDVSSLIFLRISTEDRLDGFEVRLQVQQETQIELQSLVIFSTNNRRWSAR
ncbi:hypothetical protein [Sphingomonas crocodyli]|uniref:Uncharacterized protein n=1 Tax=Sphingomonas crocodyli TaxID=1979270 RepID=A0A437MBL1_9SPHN|nr:hypothetical protein [Sphingomonas crocodyli]RVT94943.1 hypothetical protein EOD43_14400 [Sphingomonas crocodyli]